MAAHLLQVLTKALAIKHRIELIGLHNIIPHQHWTENELLAEADQRRRYDLKWELSHFATLGPQIVGLCIAFHDRDTRPESSFLYLHRIAVDAKYRRRGIGRSLVRETCWSFASLMQNAECEVIVQTPALEKEDTNSALGFYLKLGFRIVGEKAHTNRVDYILKAVVGDF